MLNPDCHKPLGSLRTCALRRGVAIRTSRRAISPDQLGGVMLVYVTTNSVLDGARFDLSLREAESRIDQVIRDLEAGAVMKRNGDAR